MKLRAFSLYLCVASLALLVLLMEGTAASREEGSVSSGRSSSHDLWAAEAGGKRAAEDTPPVEAGICLYNTANGHYYGLTPYMPWEDAEALAVAAGGHLVTINDAEEEEWLWSQFGTSEEFWIGCNDIGHEGTWTWSSGESTDHENWCLNEPNNSHAGGLPENAALMNWSDAFSSSCWNDFLETREMRAIMEAESCVCVLPYYSQVDPRWYWCPMDTGAHGVCTKCDLIGCCGCALTSAAMVLSTYGGDRKPDQLSGCMGTSACPFYWPDGAVCSRGAANFPDNGRQKWSEPDWAFLDREINENHRPVILGMRSRDVPTRTHFVVVYSGQGSSPQDYRVNDPGHKCGFNLLLSTRPESVWKYEWVITYEGLTKCHDLVPLIPPCFSKGSDPEEVVFGTGGDGVVSSPDVSGEIWLYRRTEVTMTVEVTAQSTMGSIADVVIWSDSMSNTNWQTFTPFLWLPASDTVYARFRDDVGNVSDPVSDTLHRIGPPFLPLRLYLPTVIRG